MTTARRRKASNRSVAIRRVKSRKSQNAKRLKTFRRKTRNVVMRGGANGIKLYYEPAISPPRCIIIKEGVRGRRDPLYLFFAMDITPNEINDYVRSAMGLEKSATFEPQFIAKPNENTKLKLDDLFVNLSGMLEYSIESGYLQRTNEQKYKRLNTSKNHKIASPPKITKWEQVLDNLKQKGHEFIEYKPFSQIYNGISSDVAEEGYYSAMFGQKSDEKDRIRVQNDNCDKRIGTVNINIKGNIDKAKEKLYRWSTLIKDAVLDLPGETKDDFIVRMNGHMNGFDEFKSSNSNYNSTINDLRSSVETLKVSVDYNRLPDECKRRFDELYNISMYKTIEEIYDEVVRT